MSSTRHAAPGSPFHPERYSSSPEYQVGLPAHEVARRCSLISSREDRELIWFLQAMSHTEGGLGKVAAELMEAGGKAVDEEYCFQNSLERDLERICLDPECEKLSKGIPFFADFKKHLRKYMAEYSESQMKGLVITDVGRCVVETLEYALQGKCLAIVDGLARMGKTFITKAWCAARPGKVRYVQVPPSNDDASFLRVISQSLGQSSRLTMKAWERSERVQDSIRFGDLMLVFDEAHYLWPNMARLRNTLPKRINWIMSNLVNNNVAVALITTPQFTANLKTVEKCTHWASEQFIGRISHHELLPDTLSTKDLTSVAEYLLPEGDSKSIEGLVVYAQSSAKYLQAIEAAVKRARFLAQREGRSLLTTRDIREAVKGCARSDTSIAESLGILKRAPAPRADLSRRPIAGPMQRPVKGPEKGLPVRVETPAREAVLVTV